VTTPRGTYIRALEFALGEPIENLGFVPADEKYGLDRETAMTIETTRAPDPKTAEGPLTGIWLSRYEYVSSGRGGQTFTDEHYVMLIQHGSQYSGAVTQRVEPFQPDHGPHAKRRSHHRDLERKDEPERVLPGLCLPRGYSVPARPDRPPDAGSMGGIRQGL
jgi:hypothetical protein